MSKDFFRTIFWPILYFFEKGSEAASTEGYRPSHRKILFAVGFLFFILSMATLFFVIVTGTLGGLFPVAVFAFISLVCAVVATLGSDGAVAKIWGNQSPEK
ncbi:hypothetical protein [Marinobacter confluentis]|uniref:Uncharacterized protein n=1 Tax=Marinobacter confluentis TaxID=1697557 RepID=A0A4Z1CIV2_9GAMM|nr:hypothetical protein [Marinobacter confluentis]TGN41122.1 hypothetical protein E5Q11_00780 [Marinobacter confluentis]